MPYQFIDDRAIADVEFRAWGPDLAEVFSAAATATMQVMIENLHSIQPKQHRQILLKNDTLDILLFDFLQEFIYWKDSEQLLLRPRAIKIEEKNRGYCLQAEISGEILNPQRHQQGVDVKAITLHHFSLEPDDKGWVANVILDI